jgi:hypothetical protein
MGAEERLWWRRIFCVYGVLSLSTMAGMSLGGTVFVVASAVVLFRGWREWGRVTVGELKPLFWPSVAVFLTAFLSLGAALIWPPLGEPVGAFGELKKFHHFLYPPLIALALLRSCDQIERHPFWKFWGGMGIFCGILAVAQFFGQDLFPEDWLGHRFFRPVGMTGRFHGQGLMFFHLSFASAMTFVAALGVGRVLWPLSWDRRGDRIFWGLVAVAGIVGVYFSFSRIALAGLVVVVALLGFLRRPLLGLGVLGISLLLAVVLWWQSPALRDRFLRTLEGNQERVVLWEASLEMFKDRPLLGFGFARSAQYTPAYAEKILGHPAGFTSHAHNNVLDTLASTGLFGLAAYLAWSFSLLAWAWRSFRSSAAKWLPASAFAALVGFQVNGLTQVNFWDGKSQHTLMLFAGLAMALAVRHRRRDI